MNPSQLFTWRKRFRAQLGLPAPARVVLPAFAAVEVTAVPDSAKALGEAGPQPDSVTAGGVIEIELPHGRRIRPFFSP